MKEFLMCEICRQVIGAFYPADLSEPLTGAMFLSKDMPHGFPAPFQPGANWELFRCPYCQRRPMVNKGIVFTPNGFIDTRTKEKVNRPLPERAALEQDISESILSSSQRIGVDIAERIRIDQGLLESQRAARFKEGRLEEIEPEPEPEPEPIVVAVAEPEPEPEIEDQPELTNPVYDPVVASKEERIEEAKRRIALDGDEDEEEEPEDPDDESETEEGPTREINFPCPIEGCTSGYKRLADLHRHLFRVHGIDGRKMTGGAHANGRQRKQAYFVIEK